MYVADDLIRYNVSELERAGVENPDLECDYCSLPAVESIPVYNPADSVRGVEGAYSVVHVCNEHLNDGIYLEERFTCEGCGELFVQNHSWDFLAVRDSEGSLWCQKCYIDNCLEPVELGDLISDLANGQTIQWKRINDIPGHELLWEDEFSEWSDFPGHTSLLTVARDILEAANERGLDETTPLYPVLTQGYQFSVVLGVYLA